MIIIIANKELKYGKGPENPGTGSDISDGFKRNRYTEEELRPELNELRPQTICLSGKSMQAEGIARASTLIRSDLTYGRNKKASVLKWNDQPGE